MEMPTKNVWKCLKNCMEMPRAIETAPNKPSALISYICVEVGWLLQTN